MTPPAASPASTAASAAIEGPVRAELASILPTVAPLRAMKLPAVAERTLDNGLRVVAARRSGVPRLEARLVVPLARKNKAPEPALADMLAKTILAGTAERSSVEIAQELQRLGGNLDAGCDSEDLALYGSTLAPDLPRFLALLAQVLSSATHPGDEVALQREVMVQEISLARSQPSTLASEALFRRLYGDHPYGHGLPSPDDVHAVKPAALRRMQDKLVRPEGSVLVLVGDVAPNRALDLAERALAPWAPGGAAPGLATPPVPAPGPTLLIDRPGSVQTTIRIGGPAIGRGHPDQPKLALANLVFGGYFTSRLVDNIRERRGYTYSPGSGVKQQRRAATFTIHADVGTEVTGPALVETRYELSRMLVGPLSEAELTSAKRYLAGTMSMSIQTQAGLAAQLANLTASGLGIEYLRDFPAAVEALEESEVLEAARLYLDPRRHLTVLVGDAAVIRPAIEALDRLEVEVVPV